MKGRAEGIVNGIVRVLYVPSGDYACAERGTLYIVVLPLACTREANAILCQLYLNLEKYPHSPEQKITMSDFSF